MTIVTAKWSLQDYHRMIETGILDERKVELLDGKIIEMSPEGAPHSSYVGIEEYWVVNLQESTLVIFRNLTANSYTSETIFRSGTISPLAFPDLAIDIHQLLA